MLRRITGADVPNAIYPSNNPEGIPTLRLDRQADVLDAPFVRWGQNCRKSRMRGCFHFYTGDERFSRLWSRPQDLVNSACVAAVEPNFSVHAQAPHAIALYQTYRKRWLARLWQDQGIRIWVDLHVAAEHRYTNLLGVPWGWRAYATRGTGHDLKVEYELARRRAGATPLFLVYGGGQDVAELARREGWLWMPEEATEVRAPVAKERLRAV